MEFIRSTSLYNYRLHIEVHLDLVRTPVRGHFETVPTGRAIIEEANKMSAQARSLDGEDTRDLIAEARLDNRKPMKM